MTTEEREGCLALIEALYGKADQSLLERAIEAIEAAAVPSADGWAALIPHPVVKAWDKLSLSSKFVAYAIAVNLENDLDD